LGSYFAATLDAHQSRTNSHGIDEASSLIFGHLLSGRHGYSLSVCGYAHSSFLRKFNFTSVLPYKSKSKPFLNRITLVWIFHYILLIVTVFSSINIKAKVRRIDSGKLACVTYHENGQLNDRKFPTLDAAMGSGEYVFGTSMGHIRSQEDVPVTTHAFPPQLTDMFVDGTTIVGDGLVTDIFTTCKCSASFNDESLVAAGVSNSVVSQVKTKLTALGKRLGMVNHIESVDADEIYVTTVFNYRYSCGGTAKNSTPVTVCKSRLFNHNTADIVASYMSDGSTSSVALKFVVIREIKEKGNMTFVHQSLKNVLGVSARPQTIDYN
jgi:hypothetical protein